MVKHLLKRNIVPKETEKQMKKDCFFFFMPLKVLLPFPFLFVVTFKELNFQKILNILKLWLSIWALLSRNVQLFLLSVAKLKLSLYLNIFRGKALLSEPVWTILVYINSNSRVLHLSWGHFIIFFCFFVFTESPQTLNHTGENKVVSASVRGFSGDFSVLRGNLSRKNWRNHESVKQKL